MRLRLRPCLLLLLVLIAPPIRPLRGQVQGRPLEEQKRNVVFAWPSTLRVVETTPIQVIPGDLVAVEIPSEEARGARQVVYECRWEEEETVFLFFKGKKERREKVPVQLQLGQQARVGVRISTNAAQQLTRERPSVREVAYEPGRVSYVATVSTALPRKPHPDADCKPNPLPSGETWYTVSVRITRFQ